MTTPRGSPLYKGASSDELRFESMISTGLPRESNVYHTFTRLADLALEHCNSRMRRASTCNWLALPLPNTAEAEQTRARLPQTNLFSIANHLGNLLKGVVQARQIPTGIYEDAFLCGLTQLLQVRLDIRFQLNTNDDQVRTAFCISNRGLR